MGMTQAYRFAGIQVAIGPQLSISPHFALSRLDLERVLPTPSKVTVSSRSALTIRGDGEVGVLLKAFFRSFVSPGLFAGSLAHPPQ